MTPTIGQRPLFTLRTSDLAGRNEELNKLRTVLRDLQVTGDKTLFFYIAGDGGMGKTRLLEWVRDQYTLPPYTLRTEILDFYNSILRTDLDLVEHIYDDIARAFDKLPGELTAGFEAYRTLRERFRRQELGAAGGDTRNQVIDAFVTAWTPLAKAGYRLIVLLDTAELLRFEDDPVRKQFNALEPVASAKRWLVEMVDDDKKLPGVLFIVAGRKAEARSLYDEFCGCAGHGISDARQRIVELGGLSRPGADEYFEKLIEALASNGASEQALQLRDEIDADLRTAFYNLTGGSPITLAMAIQLFIDGATEALPDLVHQQLDQPALPIPNAQQRLQLALIKALAEYQTFGPISIAVRYMAPARKGLTPDRLQALLRQLLPNQPEIAFKALFQELECQIFVKRLPDGSLVLHDKVADWMEEGLYREDEDRLSLVYRALVEIYRQEIAELDHSIDLLIPIAYPTASIEEDEMSQADSQANPQMDPFAEEQARKLQQQRRVRRNRVIEQMAYALRGDPGQGYKIYYELAEEAFNVGRMDYETQIRSDFLGWWLYEQPAESGQFKYRKQAEQEGLGEALINADFAIRAVQRTYSSEASAKSPAERARSATALVERILTATQKGSFTIPRFAIILLNVYADMARGQLAGSDQEIEAVRQAFAGHIQQLGKLLKQKKHPQTSIDLEIFLLLSAQAFAYYELGFFERNHGNYGEAIKNYTRSLLPYRELNFEINEARSLNDKAYALAVVGDSHSAEIAVNNALNLRKRLGFSFPIGLSYNTLGIVQMLSDRPVTALRNNGYARRIFQALNHDFGQMIACRALSEASRREAERVMDDRLRYQQRLNEAVHWGGVATSFARNLLTSKDVQLVDILIEYGSAYRDLARFCWQNPDLYTNLTYNPAQASEDLLQEAVGVAQNISGARPQLVDALIDLAYLHYYAFFDERQDKVTVLNQAERDIRFAFKEIPESYRDLYDPKHRALAKSLTVYWAHLSKVHGLLVIIEQQRIKLLHAQHAEESERQPHEENLLREAILTLYFRSLLESNVRNVRRSNQIVYEAFQAFSVKTLERLYAQAVEVSKTLGLPKDKLSLMKNYLTDNFGVGNR
ncbi:MAG: ATP-binding protein [Caldilineaceae bacterium]